jgi:D-alanyl-D-alanine carboxypeptidase/D-alanyl-D-alanine-endopeptidase (penicillin-binding protein 4)
MIKKSLSFLGAIILLVGCSSIKYQSDRSGFDELIGNINSSFDSPNFEHAHWGAFIKSLDTGEIWYRRNQNKMFMPASNQKIPTTAVALLTLGPDFNFTTDLYYTGEIVDSILIGDLVVIGDGDPTFYTRFFKDSKSIFNSWCDTLKSKGIKEIHGNIIGDDNKFDDQELGEGWSLDYLDDWYAAPIGPLQLNENYIDLKIIPSEVGEKANIKKVLSTEYVQINNELYTTDTGKTRYNFKRPYGTNEITIAGVIRRDSDTLSISPSIFNPTKYFTAVLKETIIENGIKVIGIYRDCDDIKDWNFDENNSVLLTSHKSPPLKDIIKVLLKKSQNLYAETMVRALGYTQKGEGSFKNGADVISDSLQFIGIPKNSYNYADGSGLTRYNFISPEELVKILEYMYRNKYKNIWLDALPIAGVDGTLSNRMKRTAAEGNVHAKTGTISNVRGLSGYVTTASGEKIVFSFLVNGHLLSASDTEKITDKVLEMIAEFRN